MASSAWLTPEAQNASHGVTNQSQIVSQPQVSDSSIGVQQPSLMSPPCSVSASPTPVPPVGGSTASKLAPVTSVSSPISVPPSVTGPAGHITPRPLHGTANNPVQEPVRAKFVASLGYVVPAPSFSYSVLPVMNPASGSNQQPSSAPAVKFVPPIAPAALQPPVPGQSLVNRPSFSYSVPQGIVQSATGQQLLSSNASNSPHLHSGKFTPTPTAASLQPPVPGQGLRPSSNFPGAISHNYPLSVQMPFPFPRGQVSASAGFSFAGASQPAKVETSEKSSSSSKSPSEALATEVPMGPVNSQIAHSSTTAPPTSVDINSSDKVSMDPEHSGPCSVGGAPEQPGLPNSITLSSTSNQPTSTSSSSQSPAVQFLIQGSSDLVAASVSQNMPLPAYPAPSPLTAIAPLNQSSWLSPPQTNGMQRAPLVPYSAVVPAPYPLPMHGISLTSVSSSNIQPRGVSNTAAHTTLPSQPGRNADKDLNAPGTVNSKVVGNLQKDAETKKEDAWTAHRTEMGAIYYYNSLTGESTYEKPINFKEETPKIAAQQTQFSWERLSGTDWTIVSTNDGKTYYYDVKNKVSSWQIPAEVAEIKKNQESDLLIGNIAQLESATSESGSISANLSAPAVQTGGRESVTLRSSVASFSSSSLDVIKKKLQDTGASITSSSIAPSSTVGDLNGGKAVDDEEKGPQNANAKDKPKDSNGEGNVSDSSSDSDDAERVSTKEECIIQFKEMLKERGVAPFSKWDKELPKIVFDPRFKAIPGYSSRRAIFEQYVRTRAEEERKEKRAAQKAAIDHFRHLLEEASEDIDHRTDYQTFKRKWGEDPRFGALDRKEREHLLNEKLLPLKKAAEVKIKAAVDIFKSMLREKTDISTTSRWSRVKESFRNDSRYRSVKHEDREKLFNEYIFELKDAENEAERAAKIKKDEQEKLKERERELRKRKEREEQEVERVKLKIRRKDAAASYQALLVETIKDPKASWTECKPKLEKDPQNRATNPDLGQGDSEKLFRIHVKELFERCARDYRSLLSEVITAEAAAQATRDAKSVLNSWSEAKGILKPDPRYSKMPRKERELLWLKHIEEMNRNVKSSPAMVNKLETEGRSRTSRGENLRSPRRTSHAHR